MYLVSGLSQFLFSVVAQSLTMYLMQCSMCRYLGDSLGIIITVIDQVGSLVISSYHPSYQPLHIIRHIHHSGTILIARLMSH